MSSHNGAIINKGKRKAAASVTTARGSNYLQSTQLAPSVAATTGLPTPAASPQAQSSASSPYLSSEPASASVLQQQKQQPHRIEPGRMHNMSISSILSPEESSCDSTIPHSASIPDATSASAINDGGPNARDGNSTNGGNEEEMAFTWNEDPKKIERMLRTLNPDSAEWIVWKDWADFLAEERAAATTQGSG